MKDSTISSKELDVKIKEKILSFFDHIRKAENLPQESCHDSVLAVLKNPPVGVQFKSKKFKVLLCYLLIYHYYPLEESVKAYMTLDLDDFIRISQSFWLAALMSYDNFLKYLEIQKTMTEQEFFSGICNEKKVKEVLASISLLFEEKLRKPRRIQRRKGYRDKGSLGDSSTIVNRQEAKDDFYLTELQFILEERRRIRSDKISLLEDYLRGTRGLDETQLIEFRILPQGESENETKSNRDTEIEDYVKQRSHEELINKERKYRKNLELFGPEDRKTRISAEAVRKKFDEVERLTSFNTGTE